MIRVNYLNEVGCFNNLEDVMIYYNHYEVTNLDELQALLIEEADGMPAPVLTEM